MRGLTFFSVSTLAALLLASLASFVCSGCGKGSTAQDVPDAAESPQAQAVPAPLAMPTTSSTVLAVVDAGPPPMPLRSDVALGEDTIEKPVAGEKAVFGVSYVMTLHPIDALPVSKAPEVNTAGIETARKKTESTMTIELGVQRMRAILGAGFLLPVGTELRARNDRTGHVLVNAAGDTYRIVAPSALRALLGERRFDVLPQTTAELAQLGEGARRFGQKTRRVRVDTRGARAELELARVSESIDSAQLACRLVLEIIGAPPTTPLCAADEMPAHVEIHWARRGGLMLDVTSAPHRMELTPAQLLVPPQSAAFSAAPLENAEGAMLLSQSDLAQFRTAAVETGPHVESEGLLLVNRSDELQVFWLDGVMTAWVSPNSRLLVRGLAHGRYQGMLGPFLNDGAEGPATVTVPGALRVGIADGKSQQN